MARKQYSIEAWRGVEAVGFQTRSRPDVVVREADAYVVDEGADRVYIRRIDLGNALVGERDGFAWKRMDDLAVEAVLVEQGQISLAESVALMEQ